MIDVNKVRSDFPILNTMVYGKKLVYLDNGATAQKPEAVIGTIGEAYRTYNSNIHRGVHALSDISSERYEAARETVRKFINAGSSEEIIFTSGTTGSINLVAFSFGERFIAKGDEIIVSELEHHANIVPWQMLCERKGARLKVIQVMDDGTLDLQSFNNLISERTRIVAVAHVSNALGVINPVKEIVTKAHEHNIPVLLDGAQAIQHGHVDVTDIDCDFYAFSGHKIYEPTGIGVLYGKRDWLEKIPPYQGGGDMVEKVSFAGTTYDEIPFKFEAGTTNFVGAVGLSAAIDYIVSMGIENIIARESELLEYGNRKLLSIGGLKIFGNVKNKVSIISFLLDDIHMYDAGMILDKMGIAVRTGTHCAQPLMDRFGIDGTIRASMCFYNTIEEIDILHDGLLSVKEMMS